MEKGGNHSGSGSRCIFGRKVCPSCDASVFCGFFTVRSRSSCCLPFSKQEVKQEISCFRVCHRKCFDFNVYPSDFAVLFLGAEFVTEKAGDCIQYIPLLRNEAEEMIEHCCKGVERMVGIPAEKSSSYIYQQLEALCAYMWQQESGVETAIHSVYACVLGIGMVMLSVVSAILFLQERGKVKAFLEQRRFYKNLMELAEQFRRTVKEYWKAQIKIMAVICMVCIAGLGILKVKHFFALGLLVGVLDAFPVLGTGLFFVPAGFFFLFQGKVAPGVGFFLLYLLTAVVRQFMEPRLIGSHVGVSPLLVLFSVYLGVILYGGFGFVLGPFSALLLYGIYTSLGIFKR